MDRYKRYRERHRERLSAKRREQYRANPVSSWDPEKLAKKRAKDRARIVTPEQRERKNKRALERYRALHGEPKPRLTDEEKYIRRITYQRQYDKERYARNPEKFKQRFRNFTKQNPDSIRRSQRKWRETHPDQYRNIVLQRRCELDLNALLYIESTIQDPCVYCGKTPTSLEHIEPMIYSNNNDWDNLARACQSCNSRKSKMSLLNFLVRGGMRSNEIPNHNPHDI